MSEENNTPNGNDDVTPDLDFLSEYEHYGKGRISVEVYDPEPDSEPEASRCTAAC